MYYVHEQDLTYMQNKLSFNIIYTNDVKLKSKYDRRQCTVGTDCDG